MSHSGSSGVSTNLPPIPNTDIPRQNEKVWEYQRRILQQQINNGSRYPPFNIQPLRHDRDRVATPMTEEDRFLRRQWIKDQAFSANEPRPFQPPLNPFRKIARAPGNVLDRALSSFEKGPLVRKLAARVLMGYAAFIALYYYGTYNPRTWEACGRLHFYTNRPHKLPDKEYPEDPSLFYDIGFTSRTSNFDSLTSSGR